MHRGWTRCWRCDVDSELWQQPPMYMRFWIWLQTTAAHSGNAQARGLEPGTLRATYAEIREALAYSGETMHSQATIGDMIHWLVDHGFIEHPDELEPGRQKTIRICNWDRIEGENEEASPTVAQEDLFTPPKETTVKTPYIPSPQAVKCLEAWEKKRELPTKPNGDLMAKREVYQKVFDDMHKLEKVPWEDENATPGIYSRCKWAVTEWTEGMIQSPSKMRRRSKQYPEMHQHDVMANQIASNKQRPGDSDFYTPPAGPIKRT